MDAITQVARKTTKARATYNFIVDRGGDENGLHVAPKVQSTHLVIVITGILGRVHGNFTGQLVRCKWLFCQATHSIFVLLKDLFALAPVLVVQVA